MVLRADSEIMNDSMSMSLFFTRITGVQLEVFRVPNWLAAEAPSFKR